jgi:hypothetical protein
VGHAGLDGAHRRHPEHRRALSPRLPRQSGTAARACRTITPRACGDWPRASPKHPGCSAGRSSTSRGPVPGRRRAPPPSAARRAASTRPR